VTCHRRTEEKKVLETRLQAKRHDLMSPSRRKVLQAAMVINRYVQNIDDPLARRVEVVFGSLGHQTRYESQRSMIRWTQRSRIFSAVRYNFFIIFNKFSRRFSIMAYSPISHTLGCPRRGMTYERFDCSISRRQTVQSRTVESRT
jgi:hypothetical protein